MTRIYLILLLLFPVFSNAAFQTKDLFDDCKYGSGIQNDDEENLKGLQCVVYIRGFIDCAFQNNGEIKIADHDLYNYVHFNESLMRKSYSDIAALYVAWVRDRRDSIKSYTEKEKFMERYCGDTFYEFLLSKNIS